MRLFDKLMRWLRAFLAPGELHRECLCTPHTYRSTPRWW